MSVHMLTMAQMVMVGVRQPIPICQMNLIDDLLLQIGTGSATFTRSTIGKFTQISDSLINTAAINVARFEANGYLAEGPSSNLFLHSNDQANAAWTKTRSSITEDFATSPEGITNANALIEDTSNNTHTLFQLFSASASTVYTLPIYLKGSERFRGRIRMGDNVGFLSDVTFNLQAKTITPSGGPIDATIEELVNGWFRIDITDITNVGATSVNMTVSMQDSSGNESYLGDGTSKILTYGAQSESLRFASSPISTTTTALPRDPDDLSIDAANIPAPAADHSIKLKVDALGFDSSLSQVLFNVDGETSRRVEWDTTTGAIKATHGAVTSVSTTTFSAGDSVEIVFTVGATNQTLYINKVQEDQDAKGTVTGTATAIDIGHQGGANQAFSHITSLKTFDLELNQAQVNAQ